MLIFIVKRCSVLMDEVERLNFVLDRDDDGRSFENRLDPRPGGTHPIRGGAKTKPGKNGGPSTYLSTPLSLN